MKVAFVIPFAFERFFPVSYTHLRAHETVLDLVCRLLLEKTKSHSHAQYSKLIYTTPKPTTNTISPLPPS